MSQSSFDDDELFGEAAEEMRAEVEEHLAAAREELPAAEDVWSTDADNVLGALNGLKSALDVGDAADRVRSAKKTYVLGERADAFEDADDLEREIEELEALIGDIEEAAAGVGELTGTIPAIRGALQEAEGDEGGDADEGDDE